MARWLPLLLALTLQPALAQAPRAVFGNTVISRADPAVFVQLPATARYLGTDRFVLRDPKLGNFDACEMFVFAQGQSLYWVQFESYLPSQPNIHHTYDSPRHARLGGKDFYVDTWTSAAGSKQEPGSDGEHFNTLLRKNGINRPDMAWVRLVHLTDASKRKELMIIYGEPVPKGATAKSLKKKDAWAGFEPGLVARAQKSMIVQAAGG